MSWLFLAVAILAFLAFAYHAAKRNGHGMVYAAVVLGIWIAAFLWWTGRL